MNTLHSVRLLLQDSNETALVQGTNNLHNAELNDQFKVLILPDLPAVFEIIPLLLNTFSSLLSEMCPLLVLLHPPRMCCLSVLRRPFSIYTCSLSDHLQSHHFKYHLQCYYLLNLCHQLDPPLTSKCIYLTGHWTSPFGCLTGIQPKTQCSLSPTCPSFCPPHLSNSISILPVATAKNIWSHTVLVTFLNTPYLIFQQLLLDLPLKSCEIHPSSPSLLSWSKCIFSLAWIYAET